MLTVQFSTFSNFLVYFRIPNSNTLWFQTPEKLPQNFPSLSWQRKELIKLNNKIELLTETLFTKEKGSCYLSNFFGCCCLLSTRLQMNHSSSGFYFRWRIYSQLAIRSIHNIIFLGNSTPYLKLPWILENFTRW